MTGTTDNINSIQTGSITIQNNLSTAWNTTSSLEGIFGTLIFIVLVFDILMMTVWYFFFQGKRSINLAKNIQREIYFASSLPGIRLQTEYSTINKNKLYNLSSTTIDISSNPTYFQSKNNIAIVIEYDPTYTNYASIMQDAQNNNFAIIIYSTNPTAITTDHRTLFQTYPYFEMCNSVGRIMSSLYNLLTIMPYGKK